MKYIHGLLEDINIDNENMKTNEHYMSETEKNRILELTLNKANLNNNKSTKKRYILPLAAAMTLILSFAAVFAQGGLSNIFHKLFGENIKYVNEMGTVIDESNSSNGVTFNVANMLGDENSFYIIFELIKEDGESFKDTDYIQFENLHLDFKSSGGYSWYQIEDENAGDNKATFILSGNTKKKIAGDKLTLYAEDFAEYSINEPANAFNVYDYLSANGEYINQQLIDNSQKTQAPDEDARITQEEVDKMDLIYSLTPNYVLPWKYINIPVEENLKDIYIDNVGFAENKLCIRFAVKDSEEHSLETLNFVNKNNPEDIKHNEFMLTEKKDGIDYEYYVFDISNMEELKNYDFIYTIENKLKTTTGKWEVKFKANYKNTTKIITVNKETEINNKKYIVKNIKISSIALNIEMSNNLADTMEHPSHNFNDAAAVIMKDGTTPENSGSGSSTNSLSSAINIMFKQPIDITQIEKITIGTLEITP